MTLSRYIRSAQPNVSLRNRRLVWEKYQDLCGYCFYPGEHIDHIVPWSLTRDNSIDNLILACARCNLYASSMVFHSFEEKKEYILSKRRPEIAADYALWNTEETEEDISPTKRRRYWRCGGCKRLCSITEFDLEADACEECLEIIPKLERMFKVVW